MNERVDDGVVLADSVTKLDERHRGQVLVTGSHGGWIAVDYAVKAGVRAAIFNDAGIGLERAGIAGVDALAAVGMAAAAVSHRTARIADALDSWRRGLVSHVNRVAASLGVVVGMRCDDAARRMRNAPLGRGPWTGVRESRAILRSATIESPGIVAVDSIALLTPEDEGAILVVGSHGALHGGDPASALPLADAQLAVFHDAGRGKDDAGISRLPVLDARGIPAATVDAATARIGDARSMWETGRLSCVNRAMWRRGVLAGMSVRHAIERSCLRPGSVPRCAPRWPT